eukprot:TRINITY_DN1182_c0_g1_i2.p2 TRINITY_DN1182_c0_g1~~TRINITY_DN1182_c0_g1_i2.p2  ORF type:complete len:205 (+),score=57.81 TRINITY_DN1182_c0_g1_i2:69-617(+)
MDSLHNEDWDDVFMNIDPFSIAFFGVCMGLSLCVIGAGWGIWTAGSSIVSGSIKAPRIRSKNLVSIIICEATAIYGIIIAIILMSKIKSFPDDGQGHISADFPMNKAYFAAYAVLAAGLGCGITNVAGGIAVGVAGSSTALAHAQDDRLFVRILIIEIFGGALGIFGLIVGFLCANVAEFPH